MPYLSGSKLCDISRQFGLPTEYSGKSRWEYLSDLIHFSIKNENTSKLLSFLFSKREFSKKLYDLPSNMVDIAHKEIVEKILEKINKPLHFSDYELIKNQDEFFIQKKGQSIKVPSRTLKSIDRKYISELPERAMKDIQEKNYDSVLTKSRTLLEEVFFYVIEKKGGKPNETGNINKLYGQVKDLYSMHQNKDIDRRINELLSGLEKILNAIREMRNTESDAHGVGAKRINISEHHARLFINSAMTMADFILSVYENNKNKTKNEVM